MAESEGKYLIVENLTRGWQIIPPAGRKLRQEEDDIILRPLESKEISDAWVDDFNLYRACETGRTRMYRSDERARPIPALPSNLRPTDPKLYNMIYQIVFGEDEMALNLITAEPRYISRPGEPLNTEWLKNQGIQVLEAARAWLVAWGPPPSAENRVKLIDERLDWIRRLP